MHGHLLTKDPKTLWVPVYFWGAVGELAVKNRGCQVGEGSNWLRWPSGLWFAHGTQVPESELSSSHKSSGSSLNSFCTHFIKLKTFMSRKALRSSELNEDQNQIFIAWKFCLHGSTCERTAWHIVTIFLLWLHLEKSNTVQSQAEYVMWNNNQDITSASPCAAKARSRSYMTRGTRSLDPCCCPKKIHKALLSLEKSMLFKRIPRRIWVTCTTDLPCLDEHKWDFICRIRTRSPALVQVQQRKSCPGGNNIDFNWNVMWIETHHVPPVWASGQPKKWSNPKAFKTNGQQCCFHIGHSTSVIFTCSHGAKECRKLLQTSRAISDTQIYIFCHETYCSRCRPG